MFEERLATLQQQIKIIDSESKVLKEIEDTFKILRRDIDDLHSIIMLRSLAEKLTKKKRIVFIGTGQINENVVHAYLHMQKMLQDSDIQFNGEIMFVARNGLEYDLIRNFGYPCEIWRHQSFLATYILESKVIVLSSHIFSEWGNNLLTHCASNATIVQLWHGLPAKSVGASVIKNASSFHNYARLFYDTAMVDHVCIQNFSQDVVDEYRRAFPRAIQHATGDVRTDMLFDDKYRQAFTQNKANQSFQHWLANQQGKTKILYTPTYRETLETTSDLFYKIKWFLSSLENFSVALAIKLHVATKFTLEQKQELEQICTQAGHFYFSDFRDEIYSAFTEFDAMLGDYSSIRADFALTGKPIFLWRFDETTYNKQREIDVVEAFAQLDEVSYHLSSEFQIDQLLNIIAKDEKHDIRQQFVNDHLKIFSDGHSAQRTIQVLLDIANQG